jgi:hypothetical protein
MQHQYSLNPIVMDERKYEHDVRLLLERHDGKSAPNGQIETTLRSFDGRVEFKWWCVSHNQKIQGNNNFLAPLIRRVRMNEFFFSPAARMNE